MTDASFTSDDTKATGETNQTHSSDDLGQSTVALTVVSLNRRADSFQKQQNSLAEVCVYTILFKSCFILLI